MPAANSQPEAKPSKHRAMALMGTVLFLLGALFFFSLGQRTHKLELKAYFDNAEGLREGAPVRVSGVDAGSVVSVRVRPERRQAAAEVVMRIHTPYKLHVPKDAVAGISTAGVLGEVFVDIDISKASGAPAQNGDELKTEASAKLTNEFEFYFGSRRKSSQNETGAPPEKPAPKR